MSNSSDIYRKMFDEIESDPYAPSEKYLRPIAHLLLSIHEILEKQQEELLTKNLLERVDGMTEDERYDYGDALKKQRLSKKGEISDEGNN